MIDEVPEVARSIAELRKFMDGFVRALDGLVEGVSEAAPDEVRAFLPMYGQIVPVFDERLVQCADLLGRGLRDEALGYEADAPTLLEAVTLLDLVSKPNWTTWKDALVAHDFPLPTMPRMDLAAVLFDARNTLVELKPLLDGWRRLNLSNAPLAVRLGMLRQLRRRDPNNEVWFESLVEFEKQRLMDVERDVKAAVAAKDESALAAIVAELAETWVVPVPGRITAAAGSALEGFKSSRIDRRMDEVARDLVVAHEARDLEAGRQLRGQWTALLDEKGPAAGGATRADEVESATTWVDRHDRLEALSAEIWQAIDGEPSGFRARRRWVRSLERMGQETEDLAEKLHEDIDVEPVERALERITRVLEAFGREELFRRRVMFVGIGAAALLVAGLVVGRQRMLSHERRVRDAVSALEVADTRIRAGEVIDLDAILVKLPPAVTSDPRVAGKAGLVRAERTGQEARRERLAAAREAIETKLRELDEACRVRKDPLQPWPVEFAEVTRMLAGVEATAGAVTDTEKSEIIKLKDGVDITKTRLHGQADAEVDRTVREINEQLVEYRELVTRERAAAIRGVNEQRARFQELRQRATTQAAPGADGPYEGLRITSAKIRPLVAEDGAIARQIEELSALTAKWEGFEKAVAALDAKLGDWPAYAGQLRAIASGFSDVPEARDYGSSAAAEPIWVVADEWARLTAKLPPLRNATPAQAEALVKGIEALGGVADGFQPVQEFKERVLPLLAVLAARKPAAVRDPVQKFLDGIWLTDIRSVVTVAEKSTRFYCLDEPTEGAYFKYVAGWKADDGWPLKQSGEPAVTVEPAPQLILRETLRKTLQQWPAQPEGLRFDEQIVDLLEAVITQKSVDPVLRMVVLRQAVLAAFEQSRALRCPEGTALKESLKDDGPDPIPGLPNEALVSWVRPDRDERPEYLQAKGKAREILDQAQDAILAMRRSITTDQKLLENSGGERFVLVGRSGRDASGRATVVPRGKPGSGSLWWLDRAGGRKPAGTLDASGRFTAANPAAPAGSPVYRMEQFGDAPGTRAPADKPKTPEKRGG